MTYRVGVIGCGRMGSTINDEVHGNTSVILPFSHTAAYMEEPRVDVVAAADVGPGTSAQPTGSAGTWSASTRAILTSWSVRNWI